MSVEPAVVFWMTLAGEPCPKERPRWGRGHTYTPATTRRAEAVIAWSALSRLKRPPMDDQKSRFQLKVRFYCGAAWGPDTDNLVKLVMDGLSPRRYRRRPSEPGLLWRNDRQVVSIDALRIDGSNEPRTEVVILRLSACHG